MFSCEYCKISKKAYFEENLRTAASKDFWASKKIEIKTLNVVTLIYTTLETKNIKNKTRFSFPVSHSGLSGLIAHFIFVIPTLLFTGINESTRIIIREEKRHTWYKFYQFKCGYQLKFSYITWTELSKFKQGWDHWKKQEGSIPEKIVGQSKEMMQLWREPKKLICNSW